MAREAAPAKFEEYKNDYPDINSQFLFVTDGYNLRSMELNAVLGISQLKRLDGYNDRRRELYNRFLNLLRKYDKFSIPNEEGNSSFCLPFICESKSLRDSLQAFLNSKGVETRPLCSGNLLRQPFLKEYSLDIEWDSNVDILHDQGFFIGNNHLITEEDFSKLEDIMYEYFEL